MDITATRLPDVRWIGYPLAIFAVLVLPHPWRWVFGLAIAAFTFIADKAVTAE